jgi:hypothetical protein
MCGVDLGDDLAVGAQHQPQHAVGAGVLRPHVDEHLVGADVELDEPEVDGACRPYWRRPDDRWLGRAPGCRSALGARVSRHKPKRGGTALRCASGMF